MIAEVEGPKAGSNAQKIYTSISRPSRLRIWGVDA